MKKELAESAKKLGIKLESGHITQFKATNFENMKLGETGKMQYWGYIDNTIRFFLLTGNWSSVLLLLPEAPENTPSVPVEDIILFCKFKYGESGAVLKDSKGKVVKDICGAQIYCLGKWKTMANLCRYASAISATHCNRGQGGGYVEKCQQCYNKFSRWGFSTDSIPQGCVHHSASPRFFITGNPVAKNQAWKNFRKTQKELVKNVIPNQSSMLNPMELRIVLKYCLGLGTLWGFLMALMINLSVQLYLRNKEMRLIEISHLRWDLSCISAAGILDGILLSLHNGKTDEHPVLLMIWSDKNIPELDTVWMLMVWLKVSGITSGYLFPNKKRLEKGCLGTEIHEDDALTYKEFCKHFYKMCYAALGVSRKFKGHSPRPSGFCLDIFRGAGDASLLACSRSKSYDNVSRYSRGAKSMLEVMKSTRQSDLIGLTDTYRMPLFLNEDEIRSVNPSGTHSVEFNVILQNFFAGIPPCNSIQQWIQYFTGSAFIETEEEIKDEFKLKFNPRSVDEMDLPTLVKELNTFAARSNRCILYKRIRQRTVSQAAVTEKDLDSAAIENTDVKEDNEEEVEVVPLLSISSRNDFVSSLKDKSKKEQLELLVQFAANDSHIQDLLSGRKKSTEFVARDKQWYHQVIQVVLHCLQQHFDSDIEAMLAHHSAFSLTKHRAHCNMKAPCNGRTPEKRSRNQ